MPSPRLLTFIDTSPLVHSTLHSIWLTQGPPLASQIFSCPESTSGMAAGGAFPELSPGFSRSWLSPLQPLLQVPTLPASWLSQAHPLIPTSEPPPRGHRRGPCSPSSASPVFPSSLLPSDSCQLLWILFLRFLWQAAPLTPQCLIIWTLEPARRLALCLPPLLSPTSILLARTPPTPAPTPCRLPAHHSSSSRAQP